MKFTSTKKPTNSLLSGILQSNQPAPQEAAPAPIKPAQVQTKPIEEDDGNHVIKFKGKLKVDYKETSADRRRKENEEEAKKEREAILAMHGKLNKKPEESVKTTTDTPPTEKQGRGAFDMSAMTRKKKDAPKVGQH